MKIGFVIPYWTTWGGSARVVQEVTKRLAAEGLDIVVFTTDVGADDERAKLRSEVDGVSIRSFRNVSHRIARRNRGFLPPAFFRAFSREISSLDLVHVVDFRHVLGSWALRRANRAGVPSVLAPHGSLPNAEGRQRLKGIYDRLLGQRDLLLADHFHVLTEIEAAAVATHGITRNRMTTIPNGVAIPDAITANERARARAALGLSETDVVLLYMGRLVPRKGLLLVLDALGQLSGQGVPVKLFVAGADDGHLSDAKRFVAEHDLGERVRFLGFIDGMQKRETIAASDVFALWSSHEGQPMAVLEAMSHGLCVVVSEAAAVAGMSEARAGLVLPERTASAGVRVLAGLLEPPAERFDLGSRARTFVESGYSWSQAIPQYIEMYEKVIDSRRQVA